MAFDTKRTTRNAGGDLGRVIRGIRLRINLGQTALARLLRWPQASLSQYESGDARPSVERLIGLLRLAATEDERGPILTALKACGVFAADLAPVPVASSAELPAEHRGQRASTQTLEEHVECGVRFQEVRSV
jgi:transcriptional regulator with XRE-family HTH domain